MVHDRSGDITAFDFHDCAPGLAPPLVPQGAARAGTSDRSDRSPETRAIATDLAALYALSILRGLRFEAIARPGTLILTEKAPPQTLGRLCADIGTLGFGPGAQPADMPALLGWISASGAAPGVQSPLWHDAAPCAPAANGTDLPPPAETAPMSAWLRWCSGRYGAALALPGRPSAPVPATPAALAARLVDEGPVRAFFVAALGFVSAGAGLRVEGPQALLRVLSDVATRAGKRAARTSLSGPRPGVVAGQIALLRSGEPPSTIPGGTRAAAVLSDLSQSVPLLLAHVARRNADAPFGATVAQRNHEPCKGWCPVSLSENLSLPPLIGTNGRPVHPTQVQGDAFVAASLAAALKLCADLGRSDVAALDALVADIGLATAAIGGAWPSEIRSEVSRGAAFGRALALAVLPEAGRRAMPAAPVRAVTELWVV